MYAVKHLKQILFLEVVSKYKFEGLILGIRRDEEGSRSKERIFSERNKDSEWDYTNQPLNCGISLKTDFPKGNHIRIHPILHWNEIDIWSYIEREKIPLVDLYFSRNGKGTEALDVPHVQDR